MILRRAVASTLQFFSVFTLFCLGFFLAVLPYLPEARMRLINMLLHDNEMFSFLGAGVFLVTLLLVLGFYGINRGRYFRIKMGQDFADVKISLIRRTLKECFQTRFLKKLVLEDLDLVSQNRLEIGVRAEKGDIEKALFTEVEKELQTLLKERFGYSGTFYLTVRSKKLP